MQHFQSRDSIGQCQKSRSESSTIRETDLKENFTDNFQKVVAKHSKMEYSIDKLKEPARWPKVVKEDRKMKKTEIKKTVKAMTVAEMRKVASQYNIKNAKKFKRVELEQMIIDAMVEANKNSNKKSYKGQYTHKQDRLAKIDSFSDKVEQVVKGTMVLAMESFETDVLQEAMRILKIKGWYRIYKRSTMIEMICEATAA